MMLFNVLMAILVVVLFLSGNIGLGLIALIGCALVAYELPRHRGQTKKPPPAEAEGGGRREQGD